MLFRSFVAQVFLPFGPDNGVGSLWNRGAKKLLHLAVILGFLNNASAFWDYVFTPIVDGTMSVAAKISSLATSNQGNGVNLNYSYSSGSGVSGLSTAQNAMHKINNTIANVQAQLGAGVVVGAAIIRGGTGWFNKVVIVISGILLMIVFFVAMVRSEEHTSELQSH